MKLLVSAVNVKEACRCIDGGADIVDVKNPEEGSLGGQSPRVIKEITKIVPKGMILSAAIGDVPDKSGFVAQAGLGLAVSGAHYIKLGLCAAFTFKAAVSLVTELVLTVKEYRKGIDIVVCGYADAHLHGLISPKRIPEIVLKSGASMAMIDTLSKGNGKGLFDYMSEQDIFSFCAGARRLGLKTALAGSLKKEDVERIVHGHYCDVIGVRSLACQGGKRTASIQVARVKAVKKLIECAEHRV